LFPTDQEPEISMRQATGFRALPAILAGAALLGHCDAPQTTTAAPPTGTAVASVASGQPAPAAASVRAAASPSDAGAPMPASITKSTFGTVDGKEVDLYVLTNAKGLVMKVTNYGTIITELHVP